MIPTINSSYHAAPSALAKRWNPNADIYVFLTTPTINRGYLLTLHQDPNFNNGKTAVA